MDVPCPKCNSTDLKKVSLAYEEGLYQSDKRAQFRGVLIGSGGPGVLVGTSKTKGTNRGGSPHKAPEWGHVESARILQRACGPPKHSSFKSSSRRPVPEVCWSHGGKIVWWVELFGPNHEIE
jgi:hypothetical protein